VVDLDGAMIGIVTPDRRDAERKGHIAPEGGEAVVLSTRTANEDSMRIAAKLGFTEVEGSRSTAPSSGWACGPRSRRPVELVLDGAGSTTRTSESSLGSLSDRRVAVRGGGRRRSSRPPGTEEK